jgi:hypothetical protein
LKPRIPGRDASEQKPALSAHGFLRVHQAQQEARRIKRQGAPASGA